MDAQVTREYRMEGRNTGCWQPISQDYLWSPSTALRVCECVCVPATSTWHHHSLWCSNQHYRTHASSCSSLVWHPAAGVRGEYAVRGWWWWWWRCRETHFSWCLWHLCSVSISSSLYAMFCPTHAQFVKQEEASHVPMEARGTDWLRARTHKDNPHPQSSHLYLSRSALSDEVMTTLLTVVTNRLRPQHLPAVWSTTTV